MMAVDASAVLAILLQEPEATAFEDVMMRAGGGVISPVNHWEVLVRARTERGETGRAAAEGLMEAVGLEIANMSGRDSRVAADAFERFGKRAAGGLNLGDCFAYALAVSEGDGLLFKGDDFTKTDAKPAAPRSPGVQEN